MELVLDIASSIEFWRQRYPGSRSPKPPPPLPPTDCAFRKEDILALTPEWIDAEFLAPTNGVLHVLSLNSRQSRKKNSACIHDWSGVVPEGSFYELQPHVWVESLPFMFLQAASILGFSEVVAFGNELCGLYSFDLRAERGFIKREKPLVGKEQLAMFLEGASTCKGVRVASRALRFVIERSASPMETFDEMTMCLPYRYGGYALPVPFMNYRVDLTLAASRIAKREKCFLDMGYPQHHLDIEHHGKYDHSFDSQLASDRARVNGLKEMGYEVIELTADQVGDLRAYEFIIKRIAGILGKRLWNQKLGATPERLALRKALFNWNASFGRIR